MPVSTRNRSIIVPPTKPNNSQQDLSDPQMVPDYIKDNFHFLMAQEETHPPIGNYISGHRSVSEASRAKLIDWLS